METMACMQLAIGELLLAMLQEAKSHAEDVAAHSRNPEEESELRSRELACVNGERDARGACLCAADWFGEACDVSILAEAVYLPRRDLRRPSRRAAAQAAHFFRGAAGLIADLDRLQHPTGSRAFLQDKFQYPPMVGIRRT